MVGVTRLKKTSEIFGKGNVRGISLLKMARSFRGEPPKRTDSQNSRGDCADYSDFAI